MFHCFEWAHITLFYQHAFRTDTENQTFLTPSLPECLMEFCKVTLTFKSVDEILWCDHSNESSLPVLTHGAICFQNFTKWNLVEMCFWLNLAVKGLMWSFHKSMIIWIKLLYFVLGCFQYHPWWRLLLSFKTRNHGQSSCCVHANHCWKVSLKSDLFYWLVLHDYMQSTLTAIYSSNHADLSVMFHCTAFILRAEFLPEDSQC